MSLYTAVKGMHDCLPPDSERWQALETLARATFQRYGFVEIRTPILEKTDLFVRSVGQTSSIVEKEMYSFTDQGDENLVLRPEGTASVVRAYIESGMVNQHPLAKLYYMGPMFRRERPQKGRLRQFHQIGAEVFGAAAPATDAEVIAMLWEFVEHQLHLPDLILEINSIGCAACRPAYLKTLQDFLAERAEKLCADCQRRLQKNPMRVLDCKTPACQVALASAPLINDAWCGGCRDHFSRVQQNLKLLHVPFVVNPKIVRGLDYYVRTAFEITTTRLGAQSAVAAGGRYDGLVKSLGGADVSGIGFALGVERLLLLLDDAGTLPLPKSQKIFFALLGDTAQQKVLPLIQQLRRDGVIVEWDFEDKSLKSQMRQADKLGAQYVVMVGDDELQRNVMVLRNMQTQEQKELSLTDTKALVAL